MGHSLGDPPLEAPEVNTSGAASGLLRLAVAEPAGAVGGQLDGDTVSEVKHVPITGSSGC